MYIIAKFFNVVATVVQIVRYLTFFICLLPHTCYELFITFSSILYLGAEPSTIRSPIRSATNPGFPGVEIPGRNFTILAEEREREREEG